MLFFPHITLKATHLLLQFSRTSLGGLDIILNPFFKWRFKDKDGNVAAWALLLRVLQRDVGLFKLDETIGNFGIHAAPKPMRFLQNCVKH